MLVLWGVCSAQSTPSLPPKKEWLYQLWVSHVSKCLFFKQTVGMYIMPNVYNAKSSNPSTFYFVLSQCRERTHFDREIKAFPNAHTTLMFMINEGRNSIIHNLEFLRLRTILLSDCLVVSR